MNQKSDAGYHSVFSYSDACFCWCCGILLMWWFLAVPASLQQLLSFPPRKNENAMDFCNCRPINELIKQGVLQPEALLKWLVHARVEPLIERMYEPRVQTVVCVMIWMQICCFFSISVWRSTDTMQLVMILFRLWLSSCWKLLCDELWSWDSKLSSWSVCIHALHFKRHLIFFNIIDFAALTLSDDNKTWTELVWIMTLDVCIQYIYNSNDAVIISSNKVSKARNHMVLLNKTVKIHNVL